MSSTLHRNRYLPLPDRRGTALCLSGGGFRAALFHLGALRRLYELDALGEVDTITSVSGGSVVAAHLAQQWTTLQAHSVDITHWERRIAAPFRAFASRNLSGWPVLTGWLRGQNRGVLAMAQRIRDRGMSTLTLDQLPTRPVFKFCASDLISAKNYVYERPGTGDTNAAPSIRVALAASVSACYPMFFRPYVAGRPQQIALVDGGVYDDRGIEPVWNTHKVLLVSDGGDVLRTERGGSLLWPALRSAAVIWDRYQVMQKRWLITNFETGRMEGTFWGINSSSAHYDNHCVQPGYSEALARDTIATIRTNFDAFSDVEAAVLENHGYLMASAAIHTHTPWLNRTGAKLRVPHPAWLSERLVRAALRDSSRKGFFGRGFFDLRGDQAFIRRGSQAPVRGVSSLESPASGGSAV
jgi:NTE family protein